MKFYIESNKGEKIASNLEDKCQSCLDACNTLGTINNNCFLEPLAKRNGIVQNKKGKVFLCCGETKTTKLFREKIENIAYAIPEFVQIRNTISEEVAQFENQRFRRSIHNVKNINAHNIQELYNIVPQEILTSDFTKQIDTIKNELLENTEKAARTFLRVAKHNAHIKAEFSTYEKITVTSPSLNIRSHRIRQVILNVFHTFTSDFEDIGVSMIIHEFNDRVNIDYESIHVAFYHIIHNASKYVKPNSKIIIKFKNEYNVVSIFIEMDSLFIEATEIDDLFKESYSGIHAKRHNKNGDGFGMYSVRKLLDLNKAQIQIIPGREKTVLNKIEYSKNLFRIDFIL